MFCFTNILNIFFSFVACSMHKNPHQNAGNGVKETLFFKIFLEKMPRTPLEVLAPSVRVGQIRVCPPKISKPVRPCIYLIVKLNIFFGSLLCTEDHKEFNENVECLMILEKNEPCETRLY